MNPTTGPQPHATDRLPSGACVLQVLPALRHGGVERGTLEVAAAIVEAGGRALVASEGGPKVARLQRLGGEHVTLPLATKNPLSLRANAGRLAGLIEENGVALVHARSRAPAWSARWASNRTGIPFVTTYHGAYSENLPLKRRYNGVMASGERIIAISHFLAGLVRARHGPPDERLRVIHRGVDLSAFDLDRVSAARLIRQMRAFGIDETQRVVLLPSRMTRLKGHATLIEAMALLAAKGCHDDTIAVLLGDANGREEYVRELGRLAKRRGLNESRLVFAPHTDDMPAALKLAEVVVSASIEPEGFGRTLAEAGAMGKPVIATDHGAAPEIVVPGETGWLVPPGDAAMLAQALAQALSLSDQARLLMGGKALARVQTYFSLDAMTSQTLAVYREVLALSVSGP